jgi:hypothetical protein
MKGKASPLPLSNQTAKFMTNTVMAFLPVTNGEVRHGQLPVKFLQIRID